MAEDYALVAVFEMAEKKSRAKKVAVAVSENKTENISESEIDAVQSGRRKAVSVDDELESIHSAGVAAAKAEQREIDAAARAERAERMEIESLAIAASTHSKSSRPHIAVLAGYGLNCEEETAEALRMAGADAKIVHFSELEEKPAKLLKYHGFVIPGGWSFADDIASGRVLANKLKHRLGQSFLSFVKSGKPVLGICNGFQVLVKLGAIPDLEGTMAQETTLVTNRQGRFENRWVTMRVEDSVCPFLKGIKFIRAPVRHGEGQFIVRDQSVLADLRKSRMIALRYCDEKLHTGAGYPLNPNGALDDIAGICNHKGNVLAFMPHPECSVRRELWPNWTRGETHEANSLKLFENFVRKASEFL